ncbi:hypothetical protein WA026_005488 [Henosepilachna vigintioctopunctata]|uniref:Uncharacterized protein n=1 Tax=Henosepilachna vigintioctopunctata TaxID=420089 RepID=A0AAW1U446_9CUCU
MKDDAKVRNRKKENGVNEFGSNTLLSEIQRRHKDVHSDRFFQHLFLGDEVQPPSVVRRNCWVYEKPFGTSKDPPTQRNARAMKMYLNHTKPVTDSKFRNNDMRTRSVSPKSLTFEKKFDSTDSMDRIGRSISLPPKLIHFSETSRPVSPVIVRRNTENRMSPAPPIIARSPSQRKIDSLKQTQHVYFKRGECTSPSILSSVHKENSEIIKYPKEVLNGVSSFTTRCAKFKDLNEFYSTLEKLGELERMANNAESKIRKKSEGEIVDYDRWKEVHQKERAEKEIDYLCEKLKKKEEDEGFLFRPKGVVNSKWKCELDRGLRIREKSVDNIKKDLEKLKIHDPTHMEKFYQAKDTYKPLWRGSSVLNLASHMVARRSQSEGRVPEGYQKFSSSDKLLTKGIGSRIWSSLSVDQVNILKEQLTEIYDQNSSKQKKVPEFNIYVPSECRSTPSHLTVRRNSDVTKPPCVYKNSTEIPSNILSETEKKRISQSLGNEVMSRIIKTPPPSRLVSPDCSIKNVSHIGSKNTKSHAIGKSASDGQLLKPSNIEIGKEIKKIKHQIPKRHEIIVASGSDSGKEGRIKSSESGSTDESTKTVIFVEKKEDIRKKVDYFEKASEKGEYIPIVHKPADEDLDDEEKYSPGTVNSSISNSCQDFKELFGENELARLTTRPLSASRKSTYTSPSLQLRTTNISPCKLSISDGASCDSLYRSRSLSPFLDEPQNAIKSGEVRRLKDKFEYVRSYYSNGLSLKPRRCFSDSNLYKQSAYLPALTHVDVDSLRRKYEYPVHAGRGRSRVRRGGVVSPVFLRAEDRFMPHINIISKIASLCSKKFDKTQSPSDEQLGEILNLKSGDVEKLKELFDKRSDISLLGKMFTSSPDIKELRDIAPYLTGSWTAHRFPRTTENTIPLISPGESVASMDTSLVRKAPTKATSLQGQSKSSILKTHQRTRSAEIPSRKATELSNELKFDSNPEEVRYRTHWTSVHTKPSVTFKGVVLFWECTS